MLFLHCVRRAASRACWTAGSNSAISTAMMAITTNSSIKVKALRIRRDITFLPNKSIIKSNRPCAEPLVSSLVIEGTRKRDSTNSVERKLHAARLSLRCGNDCESDQEMWDVRRMKLLIAATGPVYCGHYDRRATFRKASNSLVRYPTCKKCRASYQRIESEIVAPSGIRRLVRNLVPIGTAKNSPPIHRWGSRPANPAVPVGRKTLQSHLQIESIACRLLRNSVVPFGIRLSEISCAPPLKLKRWAILRRPYRD